MQHTHRLKRALTTIAEPKVFLPALIGGALVVVLILVAGPQAAFSLISHFQPVYLIAFFALMLGYEVVRIVQWRYLLTQLNIRVPVRAQVFSYLIGEFTKNLPAGNFVPDLVLTRDHGTDFGRASSSSLLISIVEVVVALTGIVIIGIGDWTWIRPLILIGSFVFLLLLWAFYRWHHSPHLMPSGHAPRWAQRVLEWKWARGALQEVREFVQGEATLFHPHVIATTALLAAGYLLFSGFALYVVIRGLGFTDITWEAALAASFFSLAVSTIIPLPTDLGSSEASGAGALVAVGLTTSGAISTLLLYRFLNLVEQVFAALVGILLFPDEFRALWHARSNKPAPAPRSA